MQTSHKENLNEKAYSFVTRLLSRGELKPGQKLSEPSLAAACGVSRTPMREAVRRLVEEGVLYQVVKSGTYVTGFGAKDVCDALGYNQTHKAIERHVDEDDGMKRPIIDRLGRTQQAIFINESGLYALILSSKLDSAKRFKHWVTSEVLPTIRKQGGYLVVKQGETDGQLMVKALQLVKSTLDARNQQISLLLPKAEYTERVLASMGCLTVTQIAKELGLVAHELNTLLCELGIQYKQSGQYLLYAPYVRKGLAQNRTIEFYLNDGTLFTYTYLVWTERGRYFIHQLLKRIAA